MPPGPPRRSENALTLSLSRCSTATIMRAKLIEVADVLDERGIHVIGRLPIDIDFRPFLYS